MNCYKTSINHYSGAVEFFEIEAADKTDALAKAKDYVRKCGHFWGGNYYENTIKCVKKIQKKRSK